MHQKINFTPFVVDLGFCQDHDGRDLVVALVKATYHFAPGEKVSLAEEKLQLPMFTQDVYYGEPTKTSLRYATDVVPPKQGTDVAVNGHVYGRNRRSIEAGLRVGKLEKVVVAFGPRCWVRPGSSEMAGPLLFDRLPLRYENAYGGAFEDASGELTVYRQNPVGVGFARAATPKTPLPGLETRGALIRSFKDRPVPAGLGFIPAAWPQRAQFAGTFDEAWSKTRRPLLPADFDERFYNAVPQDQVVVPALQGGEQVVLARLHGAAEQVSFALPRLSLTAIFRIKKRVEQIPMIADTLLIEPDEERFALTFRSTCVLGDDFRYLKSVTYSGAGWP